MKAVHLEYAAKMLEPVLCEIVFVGGVTFELWLDEFPRVPARRVSGVDVIGDIATSGDYRAISARLRERGVHPLFDKVVRRWILGDSGLAVDVVPVSDDGSMPPSSAWYRKALQEAQQVELPSGRTVQVASPPLVVATKLAHWRDCGKGSVMRNLSVYEAVVLINGRPELEDELVVADSHVREVVATELFRLRRDPLFPYLIEAATAHRGQRTAGGAEALDHRIMRLLGRLAGPDDEAGGHLRDARRGGGQADRRA